MSQKKVQQMHEGLELFGHTFVVGLAADGVTEQAEGTYGTVFTDLHQALPDITPTLTTSDAVDIAQSIFESGTHVSTRLVVWIEKERGNSVHLAYIVTMIDGSSALPAYVLVDAKDGEVLRAWRDQHTQHAPRPRQQDSTTQTPQTPAQTLPQATTTKPASARAPESHIRRGLSQSRSKYVNVWGIGGNEKIGHVYYNGTNGEPELQLTKVGNTCFFANKVSKTGDILRVVDRDLWATGDAINAVSNLASNAWISKNFTLVDGLYEAVPAFGYACPKQGEYIHADDEVKGAYSQQVDIQALMSVVANMWKEWLGVDIISVFKKANVPTPILVIPHSAPALENAAWALCFFHCGDGDTLFYPLCTAGDVLAHELGHGVTQIVNGGLLYFGQSGAWNEGFSDMIGMTFNKSYTGRLDPMIGGAVIRNGAGLRNVANPGQFGQSTSALNLTTADPHVLSGVPNHAFYLLATSPCYDPKLAMQVAQRAAHLYFTPTTSFLEGANAWVKAAKDLGYDTAPVLEAWKGVGLWQACGSRTDMPGGHYIFNTSVPQNASLADRVSFSAAANVTVSMINLTYNDVDSGILSPCGISFYSTSYASDDTIRPNIYVGIDRMPDPNTGEWDCKIDLEITQSGPTQPVCDLPGIPNATYYVVAHSRRAWARQGGNWQAWGYSDTAKAPGAPVCFHAGACTTGKDCSSGTCSKGYCA